MSDRKKNIIVGAIIIVMILLGVAALYVLVLRKPANTIETQLREMGVPVISVTSPESKPYKVEIHLQSESEDQDLTFDDIWNMLLANRAATLAYRYGPRISSYKLIVYNTSGEGISSSETFVNPEDLDQQLPPPKKSALDNETTKEILLDELNLGNLTVDQIEVVDEKPGISKGQVLFMQVSAPDVETMNSSLKSFLASSVYVLETMNKRHSTNLVLAQLKVVLDDKPIIIFAKDIEIGSTRAKAEGEEMIEDWWPYSSGPGESPQESPTSEPYPTP